MKEPANELFTQLFKRLDGIQRTLDKILEKCSAESSHSYVYSTPPSKKTKNVVEDVVVDKISAKSSSPKVKLLNCQ
jgi:hypothetical protein